MLKIVKVQKGFKGNSVVFEVPISGESNSVFMRADVPHADVDRAVVFVDARKFLACWRDEPYSIHQEQSMGSLATWPYDRKYPGAARGFAQGMNNAVPLAYVHARTEFKQFPITKTYFGLFSRTIGYEKRPVPYVTFTDGVTRTIWLLCNGAKVFSVMVSKAEAETMYRFCGVGDGPISFGNLLLNAA